MIWLLIPLALIRGILGRMGGAHGYDTNYRDIGCALTIVVDWMIILGWYSSFWWVYLLIFVAHFGAFKTYWDRLFGYDNMWFSGLVAGFCIFPILFMDFSLAPVVVIRSFALCAIWGSLTRFLPPKILVWRRDVVDEFVRYAVSI